MGRGFTNEIMSKHKLQSKSNQNRDFSRKIESRSIEPWKTEIVPELTVGHYLEGGYRRNKSRNMWKHLDLFLLYPPSRWCPTVLPYIAWYVTCHLYCTVVCYTLQRLLLILAHTILNLFYYFYCHPPLRNKLIKSKQTTEVHLHRNMSSVRPAPDLC